MTAEEEVVVLRKQLADLQKKHETVRNYISRCINKGLTTSLSEELYNALDETVGKLIEAEKRNTVDVEKIRDRMRDCVRSATEDANALVCTRVWSAWDVGTMGEDDFVSFSELDDSDIDAIINPILACLIYIGYDVILE